MKARVVNLGEICCFLYHSELFRRCLVPFITMEGGNNQDENTDVKITGTRFLGDKTKCSLCPFTVEVRCLLPPHLRSEEWIGSWTTDVAEKVVPSKWFFLHLNFFILLLFSLNLLFTDLTGLHRWMLWNCKKELILFMRKTSFQSSPSTRGKPSQIGSLRDLGGWAHLLLPCFSMEQIRSQSNKDKFVEQSRRRLTQWWGDCFLF